MSARAASRAELSAFDAALLADDDEVDDEEFDDEADAVALVSVLDAAASDADVPAASSEIVEAVSQAANKNVAANSVKRGLNIVMLPNLCANHNGLNNGKSNFYNVFIHTKKDRKPTMSSCI